MDEIWKDIKGFEGLYKISQFGRVLNLKTNYISTGFKNSDGYIKMDLYIGKIKTRFGMHRLVAEHFLPEPTKEQLEWAETTKWKKVQVNHLDHDKSNNNVSNLEWSTASQNVKYNYEKGTTKVQRGAAKLSFEIVSEIFLEFEKSNLSVIDFARLYHSKYNVCRKTIRRILYKQTWNEE